VHYFISNLAALAPIFAKLEPNGHFMVTFLDGDAVFQHLIGEEQFLINENGKIKYSILKQYAETEKVNFTQKILIKLPFADEPYLEPLVYAAHLSEVCAGAGLRLIANFNLNMYGNFKFLSQNDADVTLPDLYNSFNALSEADKLYVSLYKCMIFQK